MKNEDPTIQKLSTVLNSYTLVKSLVCSLLNSHNIVEAFSFDMIQA